MTDWIDDFYNKHTAAQADQARYSQTFPGMAARVWEALVSQIKLDINKLNAVMFPPNEGIRLNGREMTPMREQLFIDRPILPSLYLNVQLDIGGQSIKILQSRAESIEGPAVDTNERLSLSLDSRNGVVIQDASGQLLDIAGSSKYLLSRFLNRR